jgi:hypothetical protein
MSPPSFLVILIELEMHFLSNYLDSFDLPKEPLSQVIHPRNYCLLVKSVTSGILTLSRDVIGRITHPPMRFPSSNTTFMNILYTF